MLIKWTVFCMEPSMSELQARLASVVEQDDPTAMDRLYVQHRYWRDPQLYRFGCSYALDHIPEGIKEKIMKVSGFDEVYTLEKENYLLYACEATNEEMKRNPGRGYVVCDIHMDL